MKFINKEGKVFYTIKVADDDYTFTVKLCDNEIDDDNERFSSQCLKQMAEMFVGKYVCQEKKNGKLGSEGDRPVLVGWSRKLQLDHR